MFFWPWLLRENGEAAASWSDLLPRYSAQLSPHSERINLHIMGAELCEECSYATSDFSGGDLKEPPNYSFTCQSGGKKEEKKLPLDLFMCAATVAE